MSERKWSTKTLARELVKFLRTSALEPTHTIGELTDALAFKIVQDEVGEDLVWTKQP